jgi:hypothetical protein
MSYKLKFETESTEESYDLKPSRVYVDSDVEANPVVHMEVRWTQDMGVMADYKWQTNTVCTIIAKTKSNFTYKLSGIRFNWSGQEGGYNPKDRTSTLDIGGRAKTNTQIYGI